jgi:hypothetical protein
MLKSLVNLVAAWRFRCENIYFSNLTIYQSTAVEISGRWLVISGITFANNVLVDSINLIIYGRY